MTRRLVLEVGVTSADEALLAQESGADRLELCCGLEIGGVTPSPGTFLTVREAVEIPVYVLLRPRAGGFTYSAAQHEAMTRDARWFMANGAAGVVFGFVRTDGSTNRVDRDRCRRLAAEVEGRAVFHRAFDFIADPVAALDELAEIGFARIQSSGGKPTAEAGRDRLAAWIDHAAGRIEVMPAAGIKPANVGDLLRATRATQVHASLRTPEPDPSLLGNPELARAMGAVDAGSGGSTTSAELVRAVRSELDRLSLGGRSSPE